MDTQDNDASLSMTIMAGCDIIGSSGSSTVTSLGSQEREVSSMPYTPLSLSPVMSPPLAGTNLEILQRLREEYTENTK